MVDAFVHAVATCDEQGIGSGEDEYEQQWHFVEIFKANACRQEAGYEHSHRTDGEQSVALCPPWFCVGFVCGHDLCMYEYGFFLRTAKIQRNQRFIGIASL